MGTVARRRRTGSGLLSALLLLPALAVSAPADAQEAAAKGPPVVPERPEVVGVRVRSEIQGARARGRLGIHLRTTCEEPPGSCDAEPVVVSVIPGGPADRAGVRPGDELLSLDGVSLASPEGREALASLEPGTGVRLEVSGPAGRRELRVTPELREPTRTFRLERLTGPEDGHSLEARVFRFPSSEGMERLEVRLDSLAGAGTAFVVVGPDAGGSLRVEVGGEELVTVLGGSERDGAAPGTPPEGRARWVPRSPEPDAAEAGAAAPPPPVGYVVESPRLARHLERTRAVALRSARDRLDSLVRLRKEVPGTFWFAPAPEGSDGEPPVAGREGTGGSATWTLRSAAPELESLFAANARLAGAEFRRLTPELAEYFEGVEGGLLVLRVIEGTPADRLGLRGGDVVFEAAGRPVESVAKLRAALEAANGGPTLVKWVRKGEVAEGRIATP